MIRAVGLAFGFVLAFPAFAGALEIPVSEFSVKTCGAEQNGAWNLWSNGFAAEWLRFPADGAYAIEVEAAGEQAKGEWPRMRLQVDLEPCGETFVYGPKFSRRRSPRACAGSRWPS
ncbi:MAG: hypothetical protein MUC63_03775 [Planctomycetes bacterium]|nr:hypothetical protein [Planctomycetota bacterium]